MFRSVVRIARFSAMSLVERSVILCMHVSYIDLIAVLGEGWDVHTQKNLCL